MSLIRSARTLAASLQRSIKFDEPKRPLSAWIFAFFFFLLPSFLQRRLRPDKFKPRRISPTSWLDGLRGVAAFFVYINHYTGRNFVEFQRAYNDHELVNWSSPLQLPFVRVIFCGLPMVHIFFVISGIALSHKPMRLIRARQYKDLHETLASSVFRRGFRLFLPTVASTFFVLMTNYFGITGTQYPTLAEHLWDWYSALWKITDSWSWDVLWYPPYDVHLWTIGIEFSHSMLLFLVVLGTSRMKSLLRLTFLALFILYCMKGGHWGPSEFVAGIIITELTLIENERRAETDALPKSRSRAKSIKRAGYVVFLSLNVMFALFVAGWPNGKVEVQPVLGAIYKSTMEPYWTSGGNILIFPWYALGAVQIVMAVHQIPLLQRLFTSPFAQFLGDISFSLYLMHGPTQVIFEPRVLPHVWALVHGTKEAGMLQYTVAWFCGLAILIPPTLWISDIFWRLIDVNSVMFARWFEKICITQEPEGYVPLESTPMQAIVT